MQHIWKAVLAALAFGESGTHRNPGQLPGLDLRPLRSAGGVQIHVRSAGTALWAKFKVC